MSLAGIFWLAALLSGVRSYHQDTCSYGRTVIVHLFNWKWTDIAAECERFLGPKGFCGVQVSPPNEHVEVRSPDRPWWERYQPVSYKLESRSGNRQQFVDMVERCNNVGVHIYVDMVVNHMCGSGAGSGTGSGGSWYDTSTLTFSGVPFGGDDFNCCQCEMCNSGNCEISNYGNRNQVRNCRLVGLLDLKLASEYVRDKVAGFFNDLLDIGVAGFRVDACKHMWPGDMEAVYARMRGLNTRWFPDNTRPFIFNEVIDLGGEAIGAGEYTHLGRVTEFKYCNEVGKAFRRQIALSNLRNIGEAWGMLPSDKALVFLDNHDNQRGHGAGGGDILTFYEPEMYKPATAFKLAHPYGFTRIMSSYRWEGGRWQNDWIGPPRNGDAIKDVPINADGSCGDDWVCEHRWRPITNMAHFRNVARGHGMENWWDNGGHQIAFGRGDRAFIAFNNEEWGGLDVTLQTGLSSGQYCDVISGDATDNGCTGTTISVDGGGRAHFSISSSADERMIAIHVEAMSGGGNPGPGSTVPTGPTDPPTRPPEGYQRTVVFVEFQSNAGQDLFIRGGVNHDQRPGCTDNAATSRCAISINHRDIGTGSHYAKLNAWKVGDQKLDWYGAEFGQGAYMGQAASGSPSAWTTSQAGGSGYQPVNRYGPHHWMFEVDMNCEETENGWFELKSFVTNYGANGGWEYDISQRRPCGGSAGGSPPYTSSNHMGRCGFINVFTFNEGGCTIDQF